MSLHLDINWSDYLFLQEFSNMYDCQEIIASHKLNELQIISRGNLQKSFHSINIKLMWDICLCQCAWQEVEYGLEKFENLQAAKDLNAEQRSGCPKSSLATRG